MGGKTLTETLLFDAETHTYRLDGTEIPSVTEIIRSAGLIDTAWYTDEGRLRGDVVHLACELHDQNKLNGWKDEQADNQIGGYLSAWKQFRARMNFMPNLIEERRYSPTLRYAGTIDRAGRIGGDGSPIDMKVVIDIKTGDPQPADAVQLAAYANLLGSPMVYERVGVYLHEDGTYKLKQYRRQDFPSDFAAFLGSLSVYNYKKRHNL
jgi:hypothetical protein